MSDSKKWKAAQRDWLVEELRELLEGWKADSETPGTFSPDENADRIARGRTGGCIVQLGDILRKLQ